MMGGEIDWGALPVFCELLDVVNPDQFASDLMLVRTHMKKEGG